MKDPRSAPDQAHYLLSGSRVPELPHAINPMYGFCVRCLRTEQELAEHPGTKDANGLTHEDYMRERDAAKLLEYKRNLSQSRPSRWSRLKQFLKAIIFPIR